MISNFVIKKISYRKDINFLRAIAVISVIFYHLNLEYFEGGWLGVDLFFFISGYLISNKLLIGLRDQKQYLRKFFRNRFQRLTPSIISLSVLTTIFSFNFLSPSELKVHIDSTFYSLTYLSNFYFSELDFYNSPSNKYLTMLHTWSLSVEEQFYILLPIIFIFVYKKNKKLIFTLFLVFFVSLLISIISTSENIFYNTFARMWEFLFGVLFMIYEKYFKKIKFNNIEYVGLLLILFSITYLGNGDINSILPKAIILIGAALFLLQNSNKPIIINTPIQTIGTISYSLYLFHQPIIAFLNIQNDKISEVNSLFKFLVFIFLFLISYLNWYFVEQKLRDQRFFIFLIVIFILIIVFFDLLVFDMPEDNEILNTPNKLFLLKIKQEDVLSQEGISCDNRSIKNSCFINRSEDSQTIYILGDSSLRTLSNAMYQNPYFDTYNLVHVTGNNCLFIFGKNPSEDACPNKNIEEKNYFGQNIENSIIIYGGRFPRYFTGEGFDNGFVKEDSDLEVIQNIKNEIKNTLEIFEKNNNEIILIYPIPAQGWNVQELIFYKNTPLDATIGYPFDTWEARKLESVEFLDSLNLKNTYRIYPDTIFCQSIVPDTCIGAHNELVYYSDDDHLNLLGSTLLSNKIMEVFEAKVQNNFNR